MNETRLPHSGTLHWAKVPRKNPREFSLTADGNVVARLIWHKMWGSLVTGEALGQTWTFKRVGFFQTRVAVRPGGSELETSSFYPTMFGGGRIEMSDGRVWSLKSRGFFNTVYDLVDSSGQIAMSLRVKGWGKGGELEFGPARPDDRTASLLAMLIWYVTLLTIEDSSAVTTVIACS